MPEALKEEDAESQISPFGSGLVDDSFTYGVRTTGVAFYKEGLFSSLPVGWGFQLYINFDFTVRKTSTDTICILRSLADSDAFQSGRCAAHNGRPETLAIIN